MLIPFISLILGILSMIISILIYLGKFSLLPKQIETICQQNKLVLIGINLIAIALMLGLLGYTLGLNLNFRYFRLLIILIGLILLKTALANNLNQLTEINPFLKFIATINNRQILQLLAIVIIVFLGVKCLVAIDGKSGDTWMYQLPFSARFWGLVSPQEYTFEAEREPFYGTSTMLPNILQGFFWKLFGLERPQGANLVSFLSLIGYFSLVKYYLKIPFYLSVITILAVPLIHIAATSCYVDLFGNIGLSITLILTYLLYLNEDFITPKNIAIFILGGFIAANSKYLLVPPLAIVMVFVFLRILWLIIFRWSTKNQKNNLVKQVVSLCLIMGFANLIIFATEFKNIILYQNPFYPLKVTILGHELNHLIVPTSTYMSDKIQAMPAIQRWVYSLLEIGAFDQRRPWPWTIAMDYVPLEADTFGMGGYFGVYVIFNILLFFWLSSQLKLGKKVNLSFVFIMSIITPFFPFAYQLRYYMYWIITLITLNLYLSLKLINSKNKSNWFKLNYIGYVGTVIMLIFCILTRWEYTYPHPLSLAKFMNEERVNPEIIANIKDNDSVCLVGFTPLTFLYNSQFHQGKHYSVKAEFNLSQEDVIKNCEQAGFKKIIYKP